MVGARAYKMAFNFLRFKGARSLVISMGRTLVLVSRLNPSWMVVMDIYFSHYSIVYNSLILIHALIIFQSCNNR